MKVANPIIVERLNDWLPPEGENKVRASSSDGKLVVDVEYTSCSDHQSLKKRSLIFERVSHFYKGPMPGIDFLDFQFNNEKLDVGSLIEFESSDFSDRYSEYMNGCSGVNLPKRKHYFVMFTSENILFHVFAVSVSVSEETSV